jgi:hypothetical protein
MHFASDTLLDFIYSFIYLFIFTVQSKVNSHIMLFLYTMLSAGSMTLLPWIPTFEVMALLRALHGFGIGGQDTCMLMIIYHPIVLTIFPN